MKDWHKITLASIDAALAVAPDICESKAKTITIDAAPGVLRCKNRVEALQRLRARFAQGEKRHDWYGGKGADRTVRPPAKPKTRRAPRLGGVLNALAVVKDFAGDSVRGLDAARATSGTLRVSNGDVVVQIAGDFNDLPEHINAATGREYSGAANETLGRDIVPTVDDYTVRAVGLDTAETFLYLCAVKGSGASTVRLHAEGMAGTYVGGKYETTDTEININATGESFARVDVKALLRIVKAARMLGDETLVIATLDAGLLRGEGLAPIVVISPTLTAVLAHS